MIEIEVTPAMISKAQEKSIAMGRLNNSIRKGAGNLVGFIGEQIAQQVLGGKNDNTYDYDLILDNGTKVDVKTKQTGYTPQPHYACSVAAFNTEQACDYYAFVRVKNDLTKGWYLGVYDKHQFYKDAVHLVKGQVDPDDPNFIIKATCYNIKVSDLKQL